MLDKLDSLQQEIANHPDARQNKLEELIQNNESFQGLLLSNEDLKKLLDIFPQSHAMILNKILQQPKLLERLAPHIGEVIKFVNLFDNRTEAVNAIFNNESVFKKIIILPTFITSFSEKCGGNVQEIFNKVLQDDNLFRILISDCNNLKQIKESFPQYYDKLLIKIKEENNFLYFIAHQENPGKAIAEFRKNFELSDIQLIEMAIHLLESSNKNKKDFCIQQINYFCFFKSSDETYYTKVNKASLVFEAVLFCLFPEKVSQGQRNLCGPASFVMLMLNDFPDKIFTSLFELVKQGYSNSVLPLKCANHSKNSDEFFSDIFLNALKHANNRYIGYSPTWFEPYRGMTEPKSLCQLFAMCGYQEIIEATLVLTQDGNELPGLFRYTLGIYSSQHRKFNDREANLEAAIDELSAGKNVMLLLDSSYFNEIFAQARNISFSEFPSTKLFGILPMQHYIVVRELMLHPDNKIDITFWSYGHACRIEKVPLDSFLKNYGGFVSALKPNSPAHESQFKKF